MNHKFLLLTLSSIFSLIFILLTYYGLTRYINLCIFKDSKTYINNYKLKNKKNTCKVVISLTFTDIYNHQHDNLRPMINSLLDQTAKVDQISINIYPNKNTHFINQYKDIVNVYKIGKDFGNCINFIPTLLREGETNTIIIVLPDKTYIFGKDYIETLIETSEEFPDNAILDTKNNVILIKPKFFDSKVVDYDHDYCNEKTYSWIRKNLIVETKELQYSENYKY